MNIWPLCEFPEISFSLIFRYFNTLQQALEGYDCVLYEMVTSRDNLNNPNGPMAAKKMKASRRGFSILGFVQKQMARILSLDYQLDCLDYGSKKWLHADLDYETFKQLQVTNFFIFVAFRVFSNACSQYYHGTSATCKRGTLMLVLLL
jgi:hypothetical protein